MSNTESLQLFEDQPIRTAWDTEAEEWYFSIVDVVWALTDQPDARLASTYWAVLKKRLNAEGASELLTNCKQLKLKASDGKRRATDVADTEQLLCIIQVLLQLMAVKKKNDFYTSGEHPEDFFRVGTQRSQWNTEFLFL